jgi:class 3 adenylate cyclase
LISEEAARSGAAGRFDPVFTSVLMAGIVGHERYQFDVWGDTVNVASRLTGASSPGAVGLTEQTSTSLNGFAVSPRGAVELKGKGSVRIVEVNARA